MSFENGRLHLPAIGMRIVKSAIVVALCYLVNIIRGGEGMVFYSQLAALWCIQMYRSNTKKNAIQRTVGTCIGAIYGLLYLIFAMYINKICGDVNNYTGVKYLEMFIISLMIVAVLYTTVVLKKQQSSYFSCVVFLSIVVNHANDLNPYLFVWNRFLDTMIGIIIGIVVNDISPSFKKDKETLFVSGLDDILVNKYDNLSAYSKVELNRMIESGMKFTISTKRTPASLLEPLRDIKLNLPVIAMDGAVLYDIQTHTYMKVYIISKSTSMKLMSLIKEHKMCWYANVIIDDTLLIHYSDELDAVNQGMVDKLRISPYRNYIKRELPENEEVVYFMILDESNKVNAFYEYLCSNGYNDELKILCYPSRDYKGYSYIKIYNKNASKENMIAYLKESTKSSEVVTFGTIQGQYDVYIHSDNFNEMVKKVHSLYEFF